MCAGLVSPEASPLGRLLAGSSRGLLSVHVCVSSSDKEEVGSGPCPPPPAAGLILTSESWGPTLQMQAPSEFRDLGGQPKKCSHPPLEGTGDAVVSATCSAAKAGLRCQHLPREALGLPLR